jgi:hypothetical protein
MDRLTGDRSAVTPWTIDEIPFQDIDRDEVHDDRQLFYSLAAASFIEITSDLYTANLVQFYAGDDEVTDWLSHRWEPEELQHGAVLKRYVQTVWPEFGWNAAYRDFFAEYQNCCAIELLAPTRALELASRCVVETGTATFYRALADVTREPVLKRIATNISSDEVRHYKNFYRFFRRYCEREHISRVAISRTLWQRMIEVDAEDAFLSFKHVFLAANPNTEFQPGDYRRFRANVRGLARRYYPWNMAVRMILRPLELKPQVVRMIVPPIVSAARLFFLL